MMTATKAKRLARQARQWGHFRDGSDVWVRCPQCDMKVSAYAGVHATKTVARSLDDAVVEHLIDDECEG